jgi:hypothetical protein
VPSQARRSKSTTTRSHTQAMDSSGLPRPRRPFRVGPRLRFLELVADVLEPPTVGPPGLGVEDLSGVTRRHVRGSHQVKRVDLPPRVRTGSSCSRATCSGSRTPRASGTWPRCSDARGGCYVFIDWWTDENELHHHAFLGPTPDELRAARSPSWASDARAACRNRSSRWPVARSERLGPDYDRVASVMVAVALRMVTRERQRECGGSRRVEAAQPPDSHNRQGENGPESR